MYKLIKGSKGSFVWNKRRVKFSDTTLDTLSQKQLDYLEQIGIIKNLGNDDKKRKQESTGENTGASKERKQKEKRNRN